MSDLLLVSHHLCPYVQRAAIALIEKGVPFERLNIDLANKPAWFLEISPRGKVPVLKAGDAGVIFESSVICEYLEDTREKPLHPADPLRRARDRAWMEFASAVLQDIWGFETARDATTVERKALDLAHKLGQVELELGAGPWFDGTEFSLVDAAFAPVFRYFDVFDAIADYGIFAQTPKVRAWRAALANRPSVQAAAPPDYPDRLRAFLEKHDAHLHHMAA